MENREDMSIYRYTLVRDLAPIVSSFSKKKIMSAYREELNKFKGERDFQLLTNTAFHFFFNKRWRVVQVIADKLI